MLVSDINSFHKKFQTLLAITSFSIDLFFYMFKLPVLSFISVTNYIQTNGWLTFIQSPRTMIKLVLLHYA